MEVMGGAPFIDGEWESICKILSFDQDSDFTNSISHIAPRDHQLDHHGGQGLMGLLMGNSNPSTSQCELGFAFNHTNQHFSTPISLNLSQLSCFRDLSNGSLGNVNRDSSQLVQAYHDDDQMSSLTSSIGFLAHDGSLMNGVVPMINGSTNNRMDNDGDDDDDANGKFLMKRKCDRLEDQADLPTSKKRHRVLHNAKIQPRKNKKASSREEEQKSSSETSDNESNGSQEVINEDTKSNPNLDGKKRANRGAATDPQSLYARKRRERINERLRILQTLVPNGTKVDISTMLEEAVNYVKFLQLQIKLLSSDDMWMYAPLAYNGFDVGHYKSFSPRLQNP